MRKIFLLTLVVVFLCPTPAMAASISSRTFNVTVEVDGTPPTTECDYVDSWYSQDLIINLTASDTQSAVRDIYYKINDGTEQIVRVAGQPLISTEGASNILEYWSVDSFGNEETPHNLLEEIKLDKTPPTVTILNPTDISAVEQSPIEVSGTIEDLVSGVSSVNIDVGGVMYSTTLDDEGNFTASNVAVIGGANTITALGYDTANNEGEDISTVFLGWMLHLDIPYRQIESYYSGAASCEMILDYIREGVGDDLTQEEIYNYGHPYNLTENTQLLEMDAKAVDYALGHFDPYDSSDLYGYGDPSKAYNFTVDTAEPDESTQYLRDIIHWIAYTVMQGYYFQDGDLATWPNAPSAVPAFGSYDHWIVVNGAATSENPTPEPRTNPWNMPDFTAYGLWLTDPAVGGIGQDLYVTAETTLNTYLSPLVSSDEYNGKYIHVSEPPPVESQAQVQLATPQINETTLRLIDIAEDLCESENLQSDSEIEERINQTARHIYDAALVVDLETDSQSGELSSQNISDAIENPELLESIFELGVKPPIELDWRQIIEPLLVTDEKFRIAFNGSQVRDFIKVKREDNDSSYYLIPFDKYIQGQFLTYAAIIIDAQTGSFKEASWVEEPTRFIQVSKEEAIALVLEQEPLLETTQLNIELVWEPGGVSVSPFYPYWKVTSNALSYIITQEAQVIDENL